MVTSQKQQILELTANILRMGKAIVPDRFPKADPEVTAEWAEIIGSISVPWEVWPEAVRLWALESVGERMVTPRELKKAAKDVISRWETTPVRQQQLRNHRRSLEDQRDQQLKDGTFAQVRGIKPREVTGPAKPQNIHELKKLALETIQRGKEQHGTG